MTIETTAHEGATTETKIVDALEYALGVSSVGMFLAARRRGRICAVLFGDSAGELTADLKARFPKADLSRTDSAMAPVLNQIMHQIDAPLQRYPDPAFDLDLQGTEFQRRVWVALRNIPCGATASYSDIARRIGAPKAARAVAGACAANPIAVAIPCHRVVRGDGGLSGYRWGVARKQALLTREGAL